MKIKFKFKDDELLFHDVDLVPVKGQIVIIERFFDKQPIAGSYIAVSVQIVYTGLGKAHYVVYLTT